MTTKQKTKHITKTFTKQHNQFYCGLACLASLVKYYGGETTQEKLREESGTTLNGTSLLGLYQAAKKLGFEAGGYEADIKNLKEQCDPVILHILKEEKLEHFVVCYGFANGKFIIGDPGWGVTEYTEEELAAVWKSKTLLKLSPGKNFVTKESETKNKRIWFLYLIKEDFPLLGIAAFLGVVISVLGLATAIFSQKLIDQILPDGDVRKLAMGIAIFAIILLARALITYVRSIFLVRQSKDMNVRLIANFFGKLLFLPQPFFNSTSTGDMIARMNDASRIQKVVVYLSSQIVIDVLVTLISAGYIFFYSISTGFISLLSVPVFGFLAWRYNKKVIFSQREVMQSYAATESKYIDTINGIKAIKTYNRENLFSKVVNAVYEFFMQKVYSLGLLGTRLNFWISFGSAILLVGVISWTSFRILSEHLMLGQMMAIITLVGGMGTSVINIAMANIQLQEARIAFDRMYEFAAAEPEYQVSDFDEQEYVLRLNKLQVKELNFRFPGRSLLFKDFNFEVNKGEMVTFFGDIGCGKSTLLSILQRFQKPESGRIIINGEDWLRHETAAWRKNLGVVEQHVHLFNGTILENIALEENPDIEKVVQFCREYGFHEFISEFQQGYATIINENSTNLSGGQRQMISFARALYNRPQLLLLDEATSAMGRRTEKFVIELLNRIKKDIAIIFVTHRPQLARYTDKIYVIEDKSITIAGRHEELIDKNRFYREAFEELVLGEKS
ncbi:peptidase domain-containing ABC transporter [Draconibacterium halophilum]|uniref:Peptidase domain-containing ABC transporter n=1 Tax=Draconibacterium halophilum TaxID=2706887 RepID=A0A6C0RHK9_9BACT|nr:peptidase domain-containing ABC transporter [Draconibacterium halophilum]QIA09589.1 peptidase domain-containing ABC transporter [Draconibacterium halophilum]